jgi:hypothetical protein
MDPGLVAVAEPGERVAGSAYVDALLNQRNALALHMAQFHARFDLLLTPTLPLPAFAVGANTPAHGAYGEDWTRWTPFTYPFNITQAPAISLPCGLTRAGLPAGLQLVGPLGATSWFCARRQHLNRRGPSRVSTPDQIDLARTSQLSAPLTTIGAEVAQFRLSPTQICRLARSVQAPGRQGAADLASCQG